MATLIYYFLFVLIIISHEADSISFNFSNISPQNENTDILITGAASISNDGIQLIPGNTDHITSGRGIYNNLLHLWDKTSGELASFSSRFSFIIGSRIEPVAADGFTFLLAVNTSVVALGGTLGVPVDDYTQSKKMVNSFVAVEFDTWWNSEWDPASLSSGDCHVGINYNSINSTVFKKWYINEGTPYEAIVAYDSFNKNLSVSVSDAVNGTIGLNYILDLRDVLPEWVIFGFSGGAGVMFDKVTVLSWNFSSSNLLVDEEKAQSPAPSLKNVTQNSTLPPTTNPGKDNKWAGGHKAGLIAGLVVAVLSFMSLIAFCFLWRRNKLRSDEEGYDAQMNKDFEQGTGPKRFTYQEVVMATANFAEANKLGEGGFGGVYKGFLRDTETYIAVKRVSKTSEQGIKEYTSEVKIISRLRHKNLVELKGWCHEKRELLLIYEFMENGSLDLHLFKQKSLLTWHKRKRIAHGLASALSYLHEECKECILHRDIKSSNVMLDSNFNVRLGDFGLARLVDHEKGTQTTMLAGTLGYMAPEYLMNGKASRESDIFSFGVVALEIASGRKPIGYEDQEKPVKLVEWVWDLYGTGTLLEAVDPSLGSDYTEEIERLVIVGLWCGHPHADQRPTMRQAIQVLNSEASLPILPPKMPKITLNAHPTLSEFGDYSSSNGSIILPSKLTISANSSPAALLC